MFLSKYILRDLIRLQDEFIIKHLIESLIYPGSIVQDDGMTRLYNSFHSVPKMLKIKKLTHGFVFNALTYNNGMIDDILQEVVTEHGRIPEDFKLECLETYIRRYQFWLAEGISFCRWVTKDAVFTEVKFLADEFKYKSMHICAFE